MLNPQTSLRSAEIPEVWYKQFWPWFLIILPGTVVIASLITVTIAFKGADALVVDNYYKEGLAINQSLADIEQAKSLNLKGSITLENHNVNLSITADSPFQDEELILTLSHPMDNHQDISVTLQNAGNGLYRAAMPEAAAGKWYMAINSVNSQKPWRINQTIYLPATTIGFSAQ